MANLLRTACSLNADRVDIAAGEECIYVRAKFRFKVPCIPGANTGADTENEFEGRSEILIADFLIRPKDLKLGDQFLEPQRGDQIVYANKLFDVVQGISGSAWRWSDVRETWYRIHTDFRKHVVTST